MGALYLGTKAEETPRKVRDIITVFDHIFKVYVEILLLILHLVERWLPKTNYGARSILKSRSKIKEYYDRNRTLYFKRIGF